MGKRRKNRSFWAAAADGLLALVDALCEGIARAGVGALRALLALLQAALRGALFLCGALVRLIAWPFARVWRALRGRRNAAWRCRHLTGEEFEQYVAQVLRDNGFRDVELTRASGDQGVDILAVRGGRRYAIQCKNYAGAVGNAAVQEAYAGAQFYGCEAAAVVCPGEFTRAARELAQSTGVRLWDGEQLTRMMKRSGRRPKGSGK